MFNYLIKTKNKHILPINIKLFYVYYEKTALHHGIDKILQL